MVDDDAPGSAGTSRRRGLGTFRFSSAPAPEVAAAPAPPAEEEEDALNRPTRQAFALGADLLDALDAPTRAGVSIADLLGPQALAPGAAATTLAPAPDDSAARPRMKTLRSIPSEPPPPQSIDDLLGDLVPPPTPVRRRDTPPSWIPPAPFAARETLPGNPFEILPPEDLANAATHIFDSQRSESLAQPPSSEARPPHRTLPSIARGPAAQPGFELGPASRRPPTFEIDLDDPPTESRRSSLHASVRPAPVPAPAPAAATADELEALLSDYLGGATTCVPLVTHAEPVRRAGMPSIEAAPSGRASVDLATALDDDDFQSNTLYVASSRLPDSGPVPSSRPIPSSGRAPISAVSPSSRAPSSRLRHTPIPREEPDD